jgi:prepilin-type N-terminal cleavage/methylation domain-containing protein
MRAKQSGFSLIEASVVLALIGLVAGVVLVSQSMMRRVELRSVLTDASI